MTENEQAHANTRDGKETKSETDRTLSILRYHRKLQENEYLLQVCNVSNEDMVRQTLAKGKDDVGEIL